MLDMPITARLDSAAMATRIVLIKFASDQFMTNGKISFHMIFPVLSPENMAVLMKSRSYRLSAMDLTCLAGQGQLKITRSTAT